MTLNEFINKRLNELGITRSQLCSAGLSWATLSKIKNGGNNISVPVKEKLAIGLKCTIGDINACLSETDDPRRKDGPEGRAGKQYEPQGVMATVDKLEKIVSEKPYVTPEPADEEPAEVFTEEPETDTDSMVLAVEEYKEQLRGQIIKHMMEAEPGTTVETLWIRIGQMVAKDVL